MKKIASRLVALTVVVVDFSYVLSDAWREGEFDWSYLLLFLLKISLVIMPSKKLINHRQPPQKAHEKQTNRRPQFLVNPRIFASMSRNIVRIPTRKRNK
ncbi:MAG: hypothetical protein V1806_12935 [Pseudomonadota bacterium]